MAGGKQKKAPRKNGMDNKKRTTKSEVCYQCGKSYTKRTFEEHKMKWHSGQAETCKSCKNVFRTVDELEEHITELGVHGTDLAAVCSDSESDKE